MIVLCKAFFRACILWELKCGGVICEGVAGRVCFNVGVAMCGSCVAGELWFVRVKFFVVDRRNLI